MLGCGTPASPDDSSAALAEVGGRVEHGYRAAGYLLLSADNTHWNGPFCGFVLTSPTVAVTAAHCLGGAQQAVQLVNPNLVLGFGHVGSSVEKSYRVAHAIYFDAVLNADLLAEDGIAVLTLATPVETMRGPLLDIPIATIGHAQPGQHVRSIGYGRETSSPDGNPPVLTGDRVSVAMVVEKTSSNSFTTTPIDGQICFGDSGSPVMIEGSSIALGVLYGFEPYDPQHPFDCPPGARGYYVALEPFREALDCFARRDYRTCGGVVIF
jgi:hypothetical protein